MSTVPHTTTGAASGGAETQTLRLSRTFKAPRARVFAAFTEPEVLKQWWGPPGVSCQVCEIDLREGGAYYLEMQGPESVHKLSGVYREVRPPERLAYTWSWETGETAGHESLVTLEFHERKGGTEVVLTHEGLPSDSSRQSHEHGWTGCFDCLAEHLAAA